MVICCVTGTYNHVYTFFCSRLKKTVKLASRASFGMAKCLYLFQIGQFSQKFQFFLGIFRWWPVESAVNVTTRLIWPDLIRSTTFIWKIWWPSRIRHDSLGVKTLNASPIFCGSLLILFFPVKICQMVICSVTGTYNHVYIFFCSRMKKAFKRASRASFGMAKCLYLFQICQLSQKFYFFAGISRWWQSWHVESAVHVTTRLIWPELTRSTTFVWKIWWPNRIRHDSLGVKTSNASPIFYGSLLILFFFVRICQMVVCPVGRHRDI